MWDHDPSANVSLWLLSLSASIMVPRFLSGDPAFQMILLFALHSTHESMSFLEAMKDPKNRINGRFNGDFRQCSVLNVSLLIPFSVDRLFMIPKFQDSFNIGNSSDNG